MSKTAALQESIIEGNKLIADFMGIRVITDEEPQYDVDNSRLNVWNISSLQYHSSWDWLMPVVDKINQNPKELELSIEAEGAFLVYDQRVKKWMIEKMPLIECVWNAIIDSIQWYNSQLKTDKP